MNQKVENYFNPENRREDREAQEDLDTGVFSPILEEEVTNGEISMEETSSLKKGDSEVIDMEMIREAPNSSEPSPEQGIPYLNKREDVHLSSEQPKSPEELLMEKNELIQTLQSNYDAEVKANNEWVKASKEWGETKKSLNEQLIQYRAEVKDLAEQLDEKIRDLELTKKISSGLSKKLNEEDKEEDKEERGGKIISGFLGFLIGATVTTGVAFGLYTLLNPDKEKEVTDELKVASNEKGIVSNVFQLEEYEQKLSDKEKIIGSLEKRINDNENSIALLEKDLKEAEERKGLLKREYDTLDEKYADVFGDLEGKQEIIKSLELKIQTNEELTTLLREDLESAEERNNSLKQEYAKVFNRLQKVNEVSSKSKYPSVDLGTLKYEMNNEQARGLGLNMPHDYDNMKIFDDYVILSKDLNVVRIYSREEMKTPIKIENLDLEVEEDSDLIVPDKGLFDYIKYLESK